MRDVVRQEIALFEVHVIVRRALDSYLAYIAAPYCTFVTKFFLFISTFCRRDGAMSMPTDLSLMDFLFEREDPILTLTDKDFVSRSDQKDIEAMTVS